MAINRIMCKLKILTDLYFIKQKIFSKKKKKKFFVKVVCGALVVKMY